MGLMKMTYGEWLKSAQTKLEAAGIGTARLDALILLESVTGHYRAWILAHLENVIDTSQSDKLNNLLKRRVQHEPMSYICGKTEFYGREFLITPAVLEPRPESETMIDLLKDLPDLPSPVGIADVGAGSGALGITAALELANNLVELLDIDDQALIVTKTNVDKFTLSIDVIKSDLLTGLNHNNQILLCNLPYVPDNFRINQAAMHEPKIAIFGGPDGLDLYRKLFNQVQSLTTKPLYILCEALPSQHARLKQIAGKVGYEPYKNQDFIQVFRFLKV
ncbi:MAG TPA: HemK/PrmC family methyltransferase [Candidatus Saccharimonadales bacterium]|jgi:release factor glutamine methyltransferase|nr:HemK/PrmC family methyltransferase [Candidatus Saccharimonadales bacterium]